MRIPRTCLALGLLLLTSSAQAQALSGVLDKVSGRSLPSDVVDAELENTAVDTAVDSFRHAAEEATGRMIAADGEGEKARPRLEEVATEAVVRFDETARSRLLEAKRDGLLTTQELASTLAAVRDGETDRLLDELEAAAGNKAAPPRDVEYRSGLAHAKAMAEYIVVERNPLSRWGLLAVAVAGTLSLVALLGRFFRALLERTGAGGPWMAWVAPVRGPIVVVAFALGAWVGIGPLWLPSSVEASLAGLLRMTLGVAGLWALWKWSDPLARWLPRLALRHWDQAQDELVDLMRKALRVMAVVGFLVFLAQEVLGADLQTLLASLGLLGLAASVAAQDTLRNLLGSVTLHSDRPFFAGDLVKFDKYFGHIEEIGFRSTTLRTLEGPLVVIPNAELVQREVLNYSRRRSVRHSYTVGLVYGTPQEHLERALAIVREVVGENAPGDGQDSAAVLHDLGEHSLQIRVWYDSPTGDYWEAMAHRGEVNRQILYRLREAGLEFAFPTQTVFVAAEEGESARQGHGEDEAAPEELGDLDRLLLVDDDEAA